MNTTAPYAAYCTRQMKVLADATRFGVVTTLMSGAQTVGDMAEALDVEQSLLSHHLRVLRDARLVEATRDGRRVEYRLAEGVRLSGDALDLGCCRMDFRSARTSAAQ